jgi:uncharacterized protein
LNGGYFNIPESCKVMDVKHRNPVKNFYNNKIKSRLKEALDDIRHPANHPRATALSMALGMFIGIFIPMGLQVWTLTLILIFIRFNIVLATLVTLISNPLTILPIYYSGIVTGETITGNVFPWSYFDKFIQDPQLDYIINFGNKGALIFFGGLFVLGLTLALLTYIVAFRVAVLIQKRAGQS